MIRFALKKDVDDILVLLREVLNVHYVLRPDLFVFNSTKYNKDELIQIINNDQIKILVYELDHKIVAHCFYHIMNNKDTNNMKSFKSLFIDDLCVKNEYRNKSIGSKMLEHVKKIAINNECYNIILNVWAHNEAIEFYKKNGFNEQKIILENILDKKEV